jgi:hypothetical protein
MSSNALSISSPLSTEYMRWMVLIHTWLSFATQEDDHYSAFLFSHLVDD